MKATITALEIKQAQYGAYVEIRIETPNTDAAHELHFGEVELQQGVKA